ncbi:hypothetical protein PV325_000369 [Microctonus aethiopoides]|nr:hypothetical protein PV325_000369 [Microctonus aethiopoides]
METLPYMVYTLHIPLEWLNGDRSYRNLLNYIYNATEDYADYHGNYDGCVLTINNIQAVLFNDNAARIWWYRRIRIEGDQRPSTVNYFPRLAPTSVENEWRWDWDEENVDSGVEE